MPMRWMSRCAPVLLVVLAASLPIQADEEEDALYQEFLAEADALYELRLEPGKTEAAIDIYEKLLAFDPERLDAYIGLAKCWVWIGRNREDEEERLAAFREAIEFAKMGLAVNPDSAEGHFWLAAGYGLFGETHGILQSLYLVPHMKREINIVIDLDDQLYGGAGYRFLGRIYHQLPGFEGGDNDKALELLQRAMVMDPDNLQNYRFLAELHLDEGRDDEARRLLEVLLSLPDEPDWMPENQVERQIARELLAELS